MRHYQGRYWIHEDGRIESRPTEEDKAKTCGRPPKAGFLKPYRSGGGYLQVSLKIDGVYVKKLVHRLVCEVYHNKPVDALQVTHKDGNKENNHKDNLTWVSDAENMERASSFGLSMEETVLKLRAEGMNKSAICRAVGITIRTLQGIIPY